MLASTVLPVFLLLSWSCTTGAQEDITYTAGALLLSLDSGAKQGVSDEELGFRLTESTISGGLLAGGAKRDLLHPKQLVPRQSVCTNPTYGLCPSRTFCCPLGGQCCTAGDCCANGSHCCTGGDCCLNTHNCVVVGGVRGCCPIGRTCTTGATQCADPGFVPCTGESFCCRPGDTCLRDTTGAAICRPPAASTTRTSTTTRTTATTSFIDLPPSSVAVPPQTTPITVPTTQTVVVPTTTTRTATTAPSMTGAPNTNTGPLWTFDGAANTSATSSSTLAPVGPPPNEGIHAITVSAVVGVLACFLHGLVAML